jgi:ADP-dependent phosphofructokinase/glucokinase
MSGLILAFNANVDAVIRVKRLPASLPAQLRALRHCMRTAGQREVQISAATARWIGRNMRMRYRIGGQVGNAANCAAALGCRFILPNVGCKSRRQMALFASDGVRIPVFERGVLALKKPLDVAERCDAPVHYVFEFGNDAHSNRFIADYDPENAVMRIDKAFAAACARHAKRIDRAMVAGFHTLGSHGDWKRRIKQCAMLIESWKNANHAIRIHLEQGDFGGRKRVLRLVLKRILPLCDSIGCNEAELRQACEALGCKERDALGQMLFLSQGVKKVVLHTPDFAAILCGKGYGVSPKRLQRSLEFACACARYRARTGTFGNAKQIGRLQGSCTARIDGRHFILARCNRIKPRGTVGIGDCFAVAQLLGEQRFGW